MHQLIIAACILALFQGGAAAPRTRFPYWQMVQEVVEQIESQTPRPPSVNTGLLTPGQEYPFESFRHLRAADLLRAAREGIQAAQLQAALGKPEAEIEAQARRNVAIALEYLPLLVKEDPDVEELIRIMSTRTEEPLVRMYILERTVTGFVTDNLLSLSLPDLVNANEPFYLERLATMSSHPAEHPEIQRRAIEVYMHRLRRQYQRVFESDPAVAALREAGTPVCYSAAVQSDAPEIAGTTIARLAGIGQQMQGFSVHIAGHIAEGSVRNERVKQITRQVLEEIRDTYLGVDRERLDAWLAGWQYDVSPALPEFPPPPEQTPPPDIPPEFPSLPEGTVYRHNLTPF